MPGPTTRGDYIGRAKGATLIALSEQRAARIAEFPPCQVCHKPMVCGQETSNRGAHFTCRPPEVNRRSDSTL